MEPKNKSGEYRTINLKPETFHRLAMLKLETEREFEHAISQDEFIGYLLDKLNAPAQATAEYA